MSQQQPTQDSQRGQYKCGECGKPFQTQNELRQHEEQTHARREMKQDKANEPGQGRGSQPQKTRGAGTQDQ
jgi:DNA-directed RNA polymerase subunit RPC12/RpoP